MAESFCSLLLSLQMEVNVKQSLLLISGGINSLERDWAVRGVNTCLSAQLFPCSNTLYFPKCSCCILTLHSYGVSLREQRFTLLLLNLCTRLVCSTPVFLERLVQRLLAWVGTQEQKEDFLGKFSWNLGMQCCCPSCDRQIFSLTY